MFRRRRKGRVLAVKLGLNPNSSSLGVDVTFLLAGAALFSVATPVLSTLVRWRSAVAGAGNEVAQPTSVDSKARANDAGGESMAPTPRDRSDS